MFDTNGRRFVVVDKEDYRAELEYSTDLVILHLPYVNNYNKHLKAEMMVHLQDLVQFVVTAGYHGLWAAVQKDNQPINKMMKIFGFVFKGQDQDLNIYLYEGEY